MKTKQKIIIILRSKYVTLHTYDICMRVRGIVGQTIRSENLPRSAYLFVYMCVRFVYFTF